MWPSKSVSPYRSESRPPKWRHTHSRQAGARSRGGTSSVDSTVEAAMAHAPDVIGPRIVRCRARRDCGLTTSGVHAAASALCAAGTARGPAPSYDRRHRAHSTPGRRHACSPTPIAAAGSRAPPPPSAPPPSRRSLFAQGAPVKIGYAIARTGPWAAGAQVSQEPNYLLWAEQVERRRRPVRQGREAPDRADRLRRPQRDRDLRAHLREADGQRQGRPDPAALGLGRQLRGRAAGQPLRLPAAGAHRALAQADRHEAAVLLLAAAAARQDDGRAGRHAGGEQREDASPSSTWTTCSAWRTSPR